MDTELIKSLTWYDAANKFVLDCVAFKQRPLKKTKNNIHRVEKNKSK